MPIYERIECGLYNLEVIIDAQSERDAELNKGKILSVREIGKIVEDIDNNVGMNLNTQNEIKMNSGELKSFL